MPRRTIDIAFTRLRLAIFIDGCFWHGCPEHYTQPRANREFWRTKAESNINRDRETTEHLRSIGWTVLRFWTHLPAVRIVNIIAEKKAELDRDSTTTNP